MHGQLVFSSIRVYLHSLIFQYFGVLAARTPLQTSSGSAYVQYVYIYIYSYIYIYNLGVPDFRTLLSGKSGFYAPYWG